MKFEDDVLTARNFYLTNRLFHANKWYLHLIFMLNSIWRGLLACLFFPIILSILPAILNYVEIIWLYGVFFLGSFFGFLYVRFISISRVNVIKDVKHQSEILHASSNELRDRFSKKERAVSKSNLEEYSNKLTKSLSILCNGYWRNMKKKFWIEPLLALLILIHFYQNPTISIASSEYLSFLLSLACVFIDLVGNGIFGAFEFFGEKIPVIESNGSASNLLIVGLIKFFIVIFFAKIVLRYFANTYEPQVWFEGNYAGLYQFIKTKFPDCLETQGNLMIQDFGPANKLGYRQADTLLVKDVEERYNTMLSDISNMPADEFTLDGLGDSAPNLFFGSEYDFYLESEKYFSKDGIWLDMALDDEWPTIYHSTPINLENVMKIQYDGIPQKVYFIDKNDQLIDTGIFVLYPCAMIIEICNKITIALLTDKGISTGVTLPLEIANPKMITNTPLKHLVLKLRNKGKQKT